MRRPAEVKHLRTQSRLVLYPHVFGNADREVGGVLVGTVPDDGGLPTVTGAIPALHADEQRATLTFTQDTWEHVHRELDSGYPPDAQIVGWYHSHPGFGIFLSEHDLFIHRNFFSGPSQIAVVIDPRACTEGLFVWRDGAIEKLYERETPSGWVAQAAGGLPPAPSERRRPAARPAAYPTWVLAVTASLGVLVGFGLFSVLSSDGGNASVRTVTAPAATQQHRRSSATARTQGTAGPRAAHTPAAPSTPAPGATTTASRPDPGVGQVVQ